MPRLFDPSASGGLERSGSFAVAPALVLIAFLATIGGCGQALALSKEQAIANCRETVGRPIVQA